MSKFKKGILAAVLLGAFAWASPLKVWSTGETLTYTDINANFSHIHSLMVGGHGARLVNSDVSSNAAISLSKLAQRPLTPRLWATVAACTVHPCAISEQYPASGVTSVGWTSAGLMTVNMPARPNAAYAAQISARGTAAVFCVSTAQTTTTVTIQCSAAATGAATNSGFSLTILDAE